MIYKSKKVDPGMKYLLISTYLKQSFIGFFVLFFKNGISGIFTTKLITTDNIG